MLRSTLLVAIAHILTITCTALPHVSDPGNNGVVSLPSNALQKRLWPFSGSDDDDDVESTSKPQPLQATRADVAGIIVSSNDNSLRDRYFILINEFAEDTFVRQSACFQIRGNIVANTRSSYKCFDLSAFDPQPLGFSLEYAKHIYKDVLASTGTEGSLKVTMDVRLSAKTSTSLLFKVAGPGWISEILRTVEKEWTCDYVGDSPLGTCVWAPSSGVPQAISNYRWNEAQSV